MFPVSSPPSKPFPRAGLSLQARPAFPSGLFLVVAAFAELHAQTTLGVGDIQVTGITSDANDSFSFVLWKDISSGTVIRFMDQSFTNATTGLLGTETDMSLTFTSALTAGTVIRVEDTGTTLTNGGTFSGTKSGSLSGISASGDQIFVYQGTAVTNSGTSFTGRTLLYGFNIADTNWVTSGTDSNNSFLPSAINSLDANIDSGNFDNADYSGTRTGMTTAAYRAAVGNLANFTQSDTRSNLATGGFTSTGSVALHWDANGTTANHGGAGTWDATTQSRFKNGASGTTYLHWVNSTTGNDHTAVFGGTAGTVTVSGGVTASGLQFDTTGYTLSASTITLSGSSTPVLATGTLAATVNSALAGTGGFTKTGTGVLTLGGASSGLSGTVSINGGQVALNHVSGLGTGTLSVGSGAESGTTNGNNAFLNTVGLTGSVTVANNITLPNDVAATSRQIHNKGGTGNVLRLTGNITGGGAGTNLYLTNDTADSAGIIRLSGTNSFTGSVTLNRGSVQIDSDAAFGATANKVTLNSYDSQSLIFSSPMTYSHATAVGNADAVFNTGANDVTASGVISTLTGTIGIIKTGSGTLTLSNTNTYNGGTTISAGTLQIGNGGTTGNLGTGAVANNAALVFNRSNNFSVSTTITGTGTVTKDGDGTMTLLGINEYTGNTTINDGTLAVDGTASGSAFIVNNGGTLGGNGTTGAVTVANGGRVGPGNSAGSLDTGNFNLQAGGTLDIEINSAGAETGYDQIKVSGSANLSGLLSLTVSYAPAANSLFFILTNDGTDAITGTFTGLANQSTFNITGQDFRISYFADSTSNSFTGGNDIALMAIPEPMAALLGGLGWVALLGRRRR